MSGPLLNQCSALRSMHAATHWNGTASSSKVSTPSRRVANRRSGSLDRMCVRVRSRIVASVNHELPKTPSPASSLHVVSSFSTDATDGLRATAAPCKAPTEVPTMRSGRTPCFMSACSIPTSAAPRCPPPPRTNAMLTRERLPNRRRTGSGSDRSISRRRYG